MSLSQDPSQQFMNEDGTPATWLEVRTPAKRRRSFLLFAVPGVALGCALWAAQLHAKGLTWSNWWVGALLAGGGLLVGFLAYLPLHSRRFSEVLVRHTIRKRLERSWGWLLSGFLLEAFLVAAALGLGSPNPPAFFWLLAVIVSPAPIRGLRILLRRQEFVPTPVAASAKEYFSDKAVQGRKAASAPPESPAQKRLRYLLALVLAAVDVYLWTAQAFAHDHALAILCGIFALL